MIIGGRMIKPLREKEQGNIGAYSNIKGFAFEYMTNGRALVLGDPMDLRWYDWRCCLFTP